MTKYVLVCLLNTFSAGFFLAECVFEHDDKRLGFVIACAVSAAWMAEKAWEARE